MLKKKPSHLIINQKSFKIRTMRFAAVQMNSTDIVEDNLLLAQSLIIQAKEEGADIVLLPENFAFMGYPKQIIQKIMEDFEQGPIQNFMSQQAQDQDIWIVAGSIPITCNEADKSFTRCIVYDNKGRIVTYYDKVHLFDVTVNGKKYNESSSIKAGNKLVSIKTPWCTVGLSICYDIRFPELYRSSDLCGVDVITVPAAFTKETGQAHWQTLLTSRAVENLSYVVASAQWGEHYGSRTTYGHSVIINPWGETMDLLRTGNGIVISDIDLDRIKSVRESFPALKHKVLFND